MKRWLDFGDLSKTMPLGSNDFQNLGGVGVLDEPRDLAVVDRPMMRKGGVHRSPCMLVCADVGTETHGLIALGNEVLRFYFKAAPIAGQRLEQALDDRVGTTPSAVVIGETFGFGPFHMGIKKCQSGRHISPTERVVEPADGL